VNEKMTLDVWKFYLSVIDKEVIKKIWVRNKN
jgi:hypothetical protein